MQQSPGREDDEGLRCSSQGSKVIRTQPSTPRLKISSVAKRPYASKPPLTSPLCISESVLRAPNVTCPHMCTPLDRSPPPPTGKGIAIKVLDGPTERFIWGGGLAQGNAGLTVVVSSVAALELAEHLFSSVLFSGHLPPP
ncbi:hypothetical protein PAMA_011422 [Pampus argenteus]